MLTIFLSIAQMSGPALAHTPGGGAHPAAAVQAVDPQDAARRDRLRRLLSVRDFAPARWEVQAQSPARLVADLPWLMDHIEDTPWVGVRAAQCILQLHAETETARIQRWVQDPTKVGLTLVVLGSLSELPAHIATPIAAAALAGPHASRVRARLHKSPHPSVRALLSTPLEGHAQ